ncbi:BZ3500_MvSof-1268-A1-R1_Chr7-1g09039 [Microbotryum saponariae]|uniref:BZ3500_MvSof-1268-A1-R1_Chr7-1g09039 protein n=1 Tax=Microbotryum saponariae TaxID=289078 RepID=A0A2X0KYG9_9BASI|nr:BZ3501_MvSof-1269-A2-R1_Chr7-1g08743 [Microbotryum saponariae]SDA02677.1 BZ3500_MvSof-1268-A1-R1_Chr7-1g09039 [Microbotryum saponariae]
MGRFTYPLVQLFEARDLKQGKQERGGPSARARSARQILAARPKRTSVDSPVDDEPKTSPVCQHLVTQVAIEVARLLARGVGPYIGVAFRGLEQRLGQQGDGVFEVRTGPRAGASKQEKEVVATIALEAQARET